MLCSRCEKRTEATTLRTRWTASERLNRVLCRGCGAVLTATDQGDRLLDKLSQLARFGLVAEATLLTSSRGDS